MIRHLELKAYGKINLGLDVVRRREDGYHEVRMIMQTVRVYDAIELNRTEEEGIRLSTNLYYLPDNENNLGYRAAKLLMDEFGIRDGVEIKMKKFIPVAAGMAGGSSDAAAVLFGVNKMFGLGLSKQELMERGVRLGADVPYCIMRGTALSEGIGEILTPLPPMPQCRVLIAKPAVSVSTKHVYESLNLPSLGAEAHPDIDAMRAAIEKKDLSGVVSQLGNVLETVTIPENPVIQTLKDKMMEMGADGSLMSGSGPTVFGLFTNQTAAQAAYEELRYGSSQDLAKQVYLTSFYNRKSNFENCVADVNIPVGEVFTSPQLAGTNGLLHVGSVYIGEFQFKDLEIRFENGIAVSYTCKNFETEEENKALVKQMILKNHETLPMGEFAIGTNTTAYEVALRYGILDKFPILIAEKMGPHFAVGDTCYSWMEDCPVFNPDGREMVARENEISAKRKENPQEAYFGCHTDITIPYSELDTIEAIHPDGTSVKIIAGGRFALPGTEKLNEPLEK